MNITGGTRGRVHVLADLSKALAFAPSRDRVAELCARHLVAIADGCVVELGRTIAVEHRRAEAADSLRGVGLVYLHAHAASHEVHAQLLLEAALGRITAWRDEVVPFADEDLALLRACGDQVELAFGRLAHRDAEAREHARALEHAHHLHELVAARDEFLSIASHELRTPISAMSLQLEMIERLIDRGAPIADVRARAGGAKAMLGRLAGLVDRLLDVTRLSAGKLVLERDQMELREVVRDVCD
ncbi:MAG TPA: histidine kinase dimerization/phospho-acceptor domain-containing protein, partial [Kofleriaceae bacterium]|nr:histidine kinase dimerization/phospho-acceptor domain-containing protein [Kofleriaceae bacterium]